MSGIEIGDLVATFKSPSCYMIGIITADYTEKKYIPSCDIWWFYCSAGFKHPDFPNEIKNYYLSVAQVFKADFARLIRYLDE